MSLRNEREVDRRGIRESRSELRRRLFKLRNSSAVGRDAPRKPTLRWLRGLSLAGLLAALVLLNPALAQSRKTSGSEFDALSTAPADELPTDVGSSRSLGGKTLRPELFYPSLRLSTAPAPAKPAPPPTVPAPTVQVLTCSNGCGAGGAPRPESPPAAKPPPRLDFEAMVQQTLGTSLPIYASDYFQLPSQEFAPVDQVNVPADFVLGPGDELTIRAWGSIDVDVTTTIARDGSITLPKVGTIALAGVRYGGLDQQIRGALQRSFRDFELSVSLGQLHSIRIYLTGFARKPGTFVISSLSTLVNALFLSGGPAPSGDLRRIEVRRGGQTITRFDLYQFLLAGDKSKDVRLSPDDVIYIPPVAALGAIAGLVHRPAIFHLQSGDTLADLVRYAGGLDTTASSRKVSIERVGEGGARELVEFDYGDAALAQPVRDGDLVLIAPISARFVNAVTLRGHVAQPVRHPWTEGMRVSDLIDSPDALVAPGYWIARNERTHQVDLLAVPGKVEVKGEFPDINWDYAVIERIGRDTLAVELLPFALGKAVRERDPAQDLLLQPGDTITVFARGDFRTPLEADATFVRVEGEVQRAGVYPMRPGETLRDVLGKAGGVTRLAYVYGIELTRQSVRAQQKRRIGEAVDRLEQDYQRYLIQRSRNTLSSDESLGIPTEAAAIRGLVERLRAAEPSGRLVLELPPGTMDALSLPALRMEADDVLYVPPMPETVEVVGALYHEGSFLYRPRKDLGAYLADAGLIPTAARDRLYVIRADGTLQRGGHGLRVLPGDTIVVPEEVDRVSLVRELKDWTQVLYQFGLGAAGLKVLKGL